MSEKEAYQSKGKWGVSMDPSGREKDCMVQIVGLLSDSLLDDVHGQNHTSQAMTYIGYGKPMFYLIHGFFISKLTVFKTAILKLLDLHIVYSLDKGCDIVFSKMI